MTLEERISELEEENAYLKSELGWAIDRDREARVRTRYKLAPGEAKVLLTLYATNRVMARCHVESALNRWGESEHVVDVYVSRIRKKIPNAVMSHRNYGYQITPDGRRAVEAAS